MKFLNKATALAFFATAFPTAADAVSPSSAFSVKLSRDPPAKNSAFTHALYEQAHQVPAIFASLNNDAPNLQGEDAANDGSHCVNVDVDALEAHEPNPADDIADGSRSVVPIKSFVTITREGEDEFLAVELSTYLRTVVAFHAEEKADYCKACDDFIDKCFGKGGEDMQEEEGEEDLTEGASCSYGISFSISTS